MWRLLLLSVATSGVCLLSGQTNRALNRSFESVSSSPSLALNWSPAWSGYSRVALTGAWDGAYAAQLANTTGTPQMRGVLQKLVFNQTAPKPVLISMRVRGENIANIASDKYGAAPYGRVVFNDGTADGVTNWCPTTSKTKNVGTFWWRYVGCNTATLLNGNLPVREIDFGAILGPVGGRAWVDGVTVAEYDPGSFGGAVTIMPDDCYKEHRTYLMPLMQQFGWVGAVAAVTNYLESGDPGYCNIQDLLDMRNAGWEVVSHSVDHSDLSVLSPTDMENEFYFSRQYLQSHGFSVRSFALPFGGYNAAVLGLNDERNYYDSIRKVERGYNPMGAFPYDIKAQELKSTTTISEVNVWLNETRNRRAWLVIFLHKIRTNCPDQYCTTPTVMQSTLNAVRNSGLPVVTYERGLTLVKSPR